MPRPRLPLGTPGSIRVYAYKNRKGTTRYRAACKYRGFDGRVRPLERHGGSRQAAIRRLQEAIRDRALELGETTVSGGTPMAKLAQIWLEEFQTLNRSPGTLEAYQRVVERHVLPALGELQVREVSAGLLDRVIKDVRSGTRTTRRVSPANQGAATAKGLRAVLSGMMGVAVRNGAIRTNPLRDIAQIESRSRSAVALSLAESRDLRDKIHASARAGDLDIVDFSDILLGTGLRIGEAAALVADAWNSEKRLIEVRGTVLRITKKGLVLKWEPKQSSHRAVRVAEWTAAVLDRRVAQSRPLEILTYDPEQRAYQQQSVHVLFPSPRGFSLRDPSNSEKGLRQVFDAAGYDVTSHAYRKTVATAMQKAGLTALEAADQLGHAQVTTTQNFYFGRQRVSHGAAKVLERVTGTDEEWG